MKPLNKYQKFEDGTVGIALNLESKNVYAVLMGEGRNVQEGSSVILEHQSEIKIQGTSASPPMQRLTVDVMSLICMTHLCCVQTVERVRVNLLAVADQLKT